MRERTVCAGSRRHGACRDAGGASGWPLVCGTGTGKAGKAEREGRAAVDVGKPGRDARKSEYTAPSRGALAR